MNIHLPTEGRTSKDMVRGEPWFDDGNIILLTLEDHTGYRVHRGVLVRNFFTCHIDIPQPTDQSELFEGCQIVVMYDSTIELTNLIHALYDGPNFSNHSIDGFFYVAGILRLSSKYFISQLRRQAIQFLGAAWPSTLAGHDSMIEEALSVRAVNNLSYPFAHPLHVLNLAREVGASILIPSAIYFLSIYPLSEILKADHPKLLVEHPSRPPSALMSSDLLLYSLMYQHRLQLMDNFIRQFFPERATKPSCGHLASCGRAFSRLIPQLHRSWTLKTGPLHFINQAIHKVSTDSTICNACRTTFQDDCSLLRQQIWKDLPTIVNLPPWEELHESSI